MAVFLGAISKGYKVGDKFRGKPDATYENDYELYKKNKSYLIDPKTKKIVKIFERPYDLLVFRHKNEKYDNFKSHWNKIKY